MKEAIMTVDELLQQLLPELRPYVIEDFGSQSIHHPLVVT
jgi:hypothetical protein